MGDDDLGLDLDDFGADDLGGGMDDLGGGLDDLDADDLGGGGGDDFGGGFDATGGEDPDDLLASVTGGGPKKSSAPAAGGGFAAPSPNSATGDDQAVYDIPVQVSAVLGKANMQVSQLLKLGRGAVVELDRKVGEPIDIYVNSRLVARGEVVVVDDRLGVTLTEIVRREG